MNYHTQHATQYVLKIIIPGLEWRIVENSTVMIVGPSTESFDWYQWWHWDWGPEHGF